MERLEKIQRLIEILLKDMPEYQEQAAYFPKEINAQRRLLRSLMNVRQPKLLHPMYLSLQDSLLSEEREEKGVIDVESLSACKKDDRFVLWQGDITRLNADAIVNAANCTLLGCFCPCHGCIDNAIHSAAGLQLREECSRIMKKQGYEEPTGMAKITKAYNLPCKYVIHTVGPIVSGKLTGKLEQQLADCYRSCLILAEENKLKSIVFCCISTGEFHFPNERAAQIAVETVRDFLQNAISIKKVVFNVFKDLDMQIYNDILKKL